MTKKSTLHKECNCQYHQGKKTIPLSDFYLNRTKKDGFNDVCKNCQRIINRINKKK